VPTEKLTTLPFHKFVKEIPLLREKKGKPLSGEFRTEQGGEQSLCLDVKVNQLRWNSHQDPYLNVKIVEAYNEISDLYFTMRCKDRFNSIDTKALPLFHTTPIINLEIPSCVWNLDSRIQSNLFRLLSNLHKQIKYNRMIGYEKTSNVFIFRWRERQPKSLILCWCSSNVHTSHLMSTSVEWGLTEILSKYFVQEWNQFCS